MNGRERLSEQFNRASELPMLVLSILFIPVVGLPWLFSLPEVWESALLAADWTIWAIFCLELMIRVWLAQQRLRYVRDHWFDVLIVVAPLLRPLRLASSARAVRGLGALRLIASAARSTHSLRVVLGAHGLGYTLLVGGLVIISSAEAVALVERDGDGNIRDFADGLWWAITTVTTVGYGDRFPVTPEGRGIAAFLMLLGITLFSFVTANIAAFLSTRERAEGPTLQELGAQIDRLEALIRDQRDSAH